MHNAAQTGLQFLIIFYLLDSGAFSHRLKLDDSFVQLKQILEQKWNDSNINGVCLLAYICYLEHIIHIPSVGNTRNQVSQELSYLKRLWVERYGMNAEIYSFITRITAGARSTFSESNNVLVNSSSIERDIACLDLEALE